MTRLILIFLLAIPSALIASPARQALVIGNSAYARAPSLANPVRDARAIGDKLKNLGFGVQEYTDLNHRGLLDALERFGEAAAGAEVILIYFAGHGVQVDGKNYLLPVEADLRDRRDLRRTLPLEALLDEATRARGLGLVILDACRDNPLAAGLAEPSGRTIAGRGLARVAAPAGNLLVAYATRDGAIAEDEGGGGHSPYARALLTHLGESVEVGLLFRRVRDSVMRATDARQQPMTYGSLGAREIYLASSSGGEPVVPYSHVAETPLLAVWAQAGRLTPVWWLGIAFLGLGSLLGVTIWRRRAVSPRPISVADLPAVAASVSPDSEQAIEVKAKPEPEAPGPRLRLMDLDDPASGFDFPSVVADAGASVIIGSGEAADWRILLDTVSRRHARLFWRADAWWIEDLDSSNGTALNGVSLSPYETKTIHPDDRITFGDHVMVFHCPTQADHTRGFADGTAPVPGWVVGAKEPSAGSGVAAAASPWFRLTGMVAGVRVARDLPRLGEAEAGQERAPSLVIGREHPADWRLALDSLSRCHARVFWNREGWWIEDLDSSNGTAVNGRWLSPRQGQRLYAQDRLTLGELVLVVEVLPPAAAESTR